MRVPDPNNRSNGNTLSDEEVRLLTRTAEGVERIDRRLDRVTENINENADEIDNLQDTVRRNTTVLGGFSTGAAAALLWLADKITRLV